MWRKLTTDDGPQMLFAVFMSLVYHLTSRRGMHIFIRIGDLAHFLFIYL
jgi:hypothetical protein